jgi:hypothetical protein
VELPGCKSAKRATPEAQLTRARQAMEELEYEQARDILVAVISAPETSQETLLQAHLLNGVVHRVLGNDVEARLSFLFVLERRPEIDLPPDLPPKVITFFELIRDEARPAARAARLSIKSEPAGAEVFLDDQPIGVAPIVTEVAAGLHNVVVVGMRDGEPSPAKVNLDVPAGKETGVMVELYETRVTADEQEAFGKRQVWHNIGWITKLAAALVLMPSCGCCVAGNPLARGDLTMLEQPANVGCLAFSVIGLCMGTAAGSWGVLDLVLGPGAPEVQVFHRVQVVPPSGHGSPWFEEIEVARITPDD